MTSYIRDFWTYTAHQQATVGDIKMSTIPADHMGWLMCDGREVSKKDFYFLYQIIGNAYNPAGYSSATHFKLPRAAGRVPGMINDPDVDGYDNLLSTWQLGDISGEEYHQLTIPEMPIHNHSGLTDLSGTGISIVTNGGHQHTVSEIPDGTQDIAALSTSATTTAAEEVRKTNQTDIQGAHTHAITDPQHRHGIQNDGGDVPHNNIQPTIFVGNMFIYSGKPRQGTYPLSIAPKYSFY
jgi:microcystin-dependent protein